MIALYAADRWAMPAGYNASMQAFRAGIHAVAVLALALLLNLGAASAQADSTVYLLQASGPITPAMAEYLDRGLAVAEQADAAAIVFALDTPGGAIDIMNRMVQSIRSSRVPVIVYVSPRGAIAGSAGTVITLAGHAAGMAPETAIGAASPVGGQGEDLDETSEEKTRQILMATARGLAARRGPEAVALAEATIDEARAVSSEEALAVGLVDVVAGDVPDLLRQLDGVTVELADGETVLSTSEAPTIPVEQSLIEQLLQAMTNPALVFLLLTIGAQAVLIELSSPGGWVAGFIGVVCLALAVYGLGILPVNWFGLIFIVMAFVLFLLEIKAPVHGALALAGLLSLVIGALVLFNTPGTPEFMRISLPAVLTVAVGTAAVFVFILTFALRAQQRPIAVGQEALVGRMGRVKSRLAPSGTIVIDGERWLAELERADETVDPGAEVEIVAIDGLRLRVKRRETSAG